MSLKIIRQGILDTIQDIGRHFHQHLGVNPGGAMDRIAMQVANSLVGNILHAPTIEMHFPAPVVLFQEETIIAITGADFTPMLNGEVIPLYHPVIVSKNSILQFNRLVHGARCYLSVFGGYKIQPWLNSTSTHIKAGVGGIDGRSLQEDDEIEFVSQLKNKSNITINTNHFRVLPWSADKRLQIDLSNRIRLLPGPEWNMLSKKTIESFTTDPFTIRNASDRMGYRLDGPVLQPDDAFEHINMVSSPVTFGTVQLLPDGQLIILMADHQTTGGYPRIATVINVDLPILAQKNPGQTIQMQITDIETAELLLLRQQHDLLQLQHACEFRLDGLLSS